VPSGSDATAERFTVAPLFTLVPAGGLESATVGGRLPSTRTLIVAAVEEERPALSVATASRL